MPSGIARTRSRAGRFWLRVSCGPASAWAYGSCNRRFRPASFRAWAWLDCSCRWRCRSSWSTGTSRTDPLVPPRVLVGVPGCKALVRTVVAPALLLPVGYHHQFPIEQPSRESGHAVRAGNLPHGRLFRQVSAEFDDGARLQRVRGEPSSLQLKARGPLDGPSTHLTIRVLLLQV